YKCTTRELRMPLRLLGAREYKGGRLWEAISAIPALPRTVFRRLSLIPPWQTLPGRRECEVLPLRISAPRQGEMFSKLAKCWFRCSFRRRLRVPAGDTFASSLVMK